jgi:hypothetical protein
LQHSLKNLACFFDLSAQIGGWGVRLRLLAGRAFSHGQVIGRLRKRRTSHPPIWANLSQSENPSGAEEGRPSGAKVQDLG